MEAFSIEELTLKQVRDLYGTQLRKDFPPDEIKPLSAIERAMGQGQYVSYGAVKGGEILSYAFFIRLKEETGPFALLDYFAVREDMRDQGLGGRFLKELSQGPLAGMSDVLVEVDDPAFAPDEKELAVRNRRLRFYRSNGLKDTGVTAVVFGVEFLILRMPSEGPMPSPRETGRRYAALYQAVMPPHIYEREVKIAVPGRGQGKTDFVSTQSC